MSRFLTKEDCGKGMLVTIEGDVFQENMAMQGQPPEMKWCINFKEVEKPLSLNHTNIELIAMATGSKETSHWNGRQVVLFDDPTIMFRGALTGGIRVRAPKGKAAAQPAPAPKPAPVAPPASTLAGPEDSDMPF